MAHSFGESNSVEKSGQQFCRRPSILPARNTVVAVEEGEAAERDAETTNGRSTLRRSLAEILVSAVGSPRRFNSFDVHEFAASAVLSQPLPALPAARLASVSAGSRRSLRLADFLTFLCDYTGPIAFSRDPLFSPPPLPLSPTVSFDPCTLLAFQSAQRMRKLLNDYALPRRFCTVSSFGFRIPIVLLPAWIWIGFIAAAMLFRGVLG